MLICCVKVTRDVRNFIIIVIVIGIFQLHPHRRRRLHMMAAAWSIRSAQSRKNGIHL